MRTFNLRPLPISSGPKLSLNQSKKRNPTRCFNSIRGRETSL